jgi:hypothetical protein
VKRMAVLRPQQRHVERNRALRGGLGGGREVRSPGSGAWCSRCSAGHSSPTAAAADTHSLPALRTSPRAVGAAARRGPVPSLAAAPPRSTCPRATRAAERCRMTTCSKTRARPTRRRRGATGTPKHRPIVGSAAPTSSTPTEPASSHRTQRASRHAAPPLHSSSKPQARRLG